MDYHFEAWQTMYEKDFDKDKFLYHYTNVSKAFKILHGKQLKFSKLNLMNDTLEAKPKLSFDKHIDSTTFQKIVCHFGYTNNHYLQLLCMSKDSRIEMSAPNERTLYSDYSGRGFALPRMWAQYADNNNGVCFIFDKSKLISIIKDTLGAELIRMGNVDYVSHFEPINIDLASVLDHVKRSGSKSEIVRNIKEVDFLKKYENFVQYNYFSKLDDWKGENEYRFLAYGDEDNYIPDVFEAIAGIVVGEFIEDSNLRIIELLSENQFEIMKISFNCDGCMLTNIDE